MKYFSLYTIIALLASIIAIGMQTVSRHEGSVHAEDENRSDTKIEVNTSEDKSKVQLRIENRIKSSQEIKEQKQITINGRKATFEQKLKEIKDLKKRALAERLSSQINKINDIRTERYLNYLNRLTHILEKLKKRISELEKSGLTVTAFQASIASIESSIDATTAKVETQQEKTYEVQIQSEATLRSDFQSVHDQLKADLTILHNEIKSIKDSIIALFRDLKAVKSPTPTSATEAN